MHPLTRDTILVASNLHKLVGKGANGAESRYRTAAEAERLALNAEGVVGRMDPLRPRYRGAS